jgi:hypothetical protein
VVAATPAPPDREQHDRAVTVDVVGNPVHAPAARDLQPAKPSGQAAAVRCCKLALALMEQVEVEGDPAEVVVAEGRQPGADLGVSTSERRPIPAMVYTLAGIARTVLRRLCAGRSGNRQQPLIAGQANHPGRREPTGLLPTRQTITEDALTSGRAGSRCRHVRTIVVLAGPATCVP